MSLVKILKTVVLSRLSKGSAVLAVFVAQLMTTVIPATTPAPLYGEELGCLAMNIYQEGRSEPTKGKLAIAAVTMNRVASRHYPNSVCSVVWQAKQFSWTNLKPKYQVIKNQKAWSNALELADLFLTGATWNGIGANVKHYHTKAVNPKWGDENLVVASIGNHVFYKLF